jgi:UDP-GlcNAc:undecaprenyl-phosphate GlcNAc-1-phosphate transferase
MIGFGLLAAIIAGSATYYLVPIMIQIAYRFQILDNPDGKLKQHTEPTPYLGGMAIYIGFIISLALVMPFCTDFIFLVMGLTILLFVGLIDDLIALTPAQKFVGQIASGICFLKGGFYLKAQFLQVYDSPLMLGAIMFIALLWILTIINSLNLVDVMDGLATTVGLCASLMFAYFAWFFHNAPAFWASMAFSGSLGAFLYFNKPRAQIYLGDTGSLLIGGFLAAIPSMISWGHYDLFGFFAPLIILFIPFAELGTLIIIRSWKNIPFYHGSPDHFSHYLKKAGWSVSAILTYVGIWNVLLFYVARAYIQRTISLEITLFIGFFGVALWWFVLFFYARRMFVAICPYLGRLQHCIAESPLFIAFRVLHNLMQK